VRIASSTEGENKALELCEEGRPEGEKMRAEVLYFLQNAVTVRL
jgi:hypothetical protein